MSPEEWNQSDTPYRMLWYLRGEVAEIDRKPPSCHRREGVLYSGTSLYAARDQCVEYAVRSRKLWSVVTGRPESQYLGRFTVQAEDMTDLLSTYDYTSNSAWDAADIVAAESMRVSCPSPTEDDLFEW